MEVQIEYQPSVIDMPVKHCVYMPQSIFSQSVFADVGCLLAEVLIVYDPGWPAELLAEPGDGGRVHK